MANPRDVLGRYVTKRGGDQNSFNPLPDCAIYVCKSAQQAIMHALDPVLIDYKNRTYNLHDSYGCIVFYDGQEIYRGYGGAKMASQPKKTPMGRIWGRDAIDEYFDSIPLHERGGDGFKVIFAAAMFYGEILESVWGRHVLYSNKRQIERYFNELNVMRGVEEIIRTSYRQSTNYWWHRHMSMLDELDTRDYARLTKSLGGSRKDISDIRYLVKKGMID